MTESKGMPVAAWTAGLFDAEGARWTFDYPGGSSVRIKPQGSRPGDWTNTISLDYYDMTPGDVTNTWLETRAREWIADRNKDMAGGSI